MSHQCKSTAESEERAQFAVDWSCFRKQIEGEERMAIQIRENYLDEVTNACVHSCQLDLSP